ncbi:hypothetical protein Vafri_6195, partial [Volvox africanus]
FKESIHKDDRLIRRKARNGVNGVPERQMDFRLTSARCDIAHPNKSGTWHFSFSLFPIGSEVVYGCHTYISGCTYIYMALTWFIEWTSRLALRGSKLSRGSNDMASSEFVVNVSNALAASISEETWPDEGPRSASISALLARCCDVGRALLDLEYSGQSQYVTVCCVPGRVPTQGLKTLDAWVARAAEGLEPNVWLPGFLFDNISNLMAAVRAADYLGCRPFQEQMLEVQLLRVALGGNVGQTEADDQQRSTRRWSIPALSSLTKAAFRQLPCMRQQRLWAPLQTGGEPSPSSTDSRPQQELATTAAEEVQAGAGRGSASMAEDIVADGNTTTRVVSPASVQEEWEELYGPVQPLDPEQGLGRGGQQVGADADEEGLRGGEQQPQPQQVSLRSLTPVEMEALVKALENSDLLQGLGASQSDIR